MRLELEPRIVPSGWVTALVSVASVLVGLVFGALVLALSGVNPLAAYRAILETSVLGGGYAISDTLVKATPLLLCGLGCAVAFRARLWNVGAEGQLMLGAWAATGVASFALPATTPSPLMLFCMAIAGALAGALWAGIAGLLKARLGVNEVITSLMLVYVAQRFLSFFIFGPWSEGGFPLTPVFPKSAWLPRLLDLGEGFAGLTLHAGLLVALLVCGGLWLATSRSVWGFGIRLLGDSPKAARYAGLPVARRMVSTLLVAGALAGLAGMLEVAGVGHRLQDRFSPGYGFIAIAVAWLGRLHPVGVLASSLVFAALLVGSKEVQPAGIAQMLQGAVMLVAVAGDFFVRYRVRLRATAPAAAKPEATP
ncbi:MAG: ABC transporter permease [Myxococcales bacterium]